MLRGKVKFICPATMLIVALSPIAGLFGTSPALASAHSASAGLHLVPVTWSSSAGSRTQPAAAGTAYQIVNADGQCLDANSNDWGANGDNIQLWSCNNHGEQVWFLSGSNIVNDDGQCLDANSNDWGANGDNIQLWSCNNHGEQSWYGSASYPYAIVNADGQCLDANSNDWGANGDNIQLWSCNNHGEQEWAYAS
jgi:hypothetical protein